MSTTTPTAQQHLHTAARGSAVTLGIIEILFGLVLGVFWLWGNLAEVQTSEALILSTSATLQFAPNLALFLQIGELFSGRLPWREFCAILYAWILQAVLLGMSIGAEVHFPTKWRRTLFVVVAGFLIGLNVIADVGSGSALGNSWQPWAFAGACLLSAAGFGLLALFLIIGGVKRIITGR
jgi:hypothetical protein